MLRVIGPAGDAATETAALLLEHDILDAPFSRGALAELPPAGAAWRVPPAELEVRVDARAWRVMSIDPPGCVDVDDAIGVRRIGPGPAGPGEDVAPGTLEVSVHIADVDFFVPENSLLDVEARARHDDVPRGPANRHAPRAALRGPGVAGTGKGAAGDVLRLELDPETFAVQNHRGSVGR